MRPGNNRSLSLLLLLQETSVFVRIESENRSDPTSGWRICWSVESGWYDQTARTPEQAVEMAYERLCEEGIISSSPSMPPTTETTENVGRSPTGISVTGEISGEWYWSKENIEKKWKPTHHSSLTSSMKERAIAMWTPTF